MCTRKMSCQIFIKNEKGQTRTVCVNSEELKNMAVKEFIRRFCPGEEEEDLDRYRYIFDSRQLEGDRTLGYYGIEDCSTIHMTVRLRGGGPLPPEDEGKGKSRTESMEALASMQKTEPESKRLCCMM